MTMKISNGVSLGNIWSIVITLMALAVLWGTNQSKLAYVEDELEELSISKADKNVVEVQLEAISSDIAEIKEMIRGLK